MMMTTLIILLILTGFLLMLLELFVLAGSTIVGFLGLLGIGAGIGLCFYYFGMGAGFLVLSSCVLLAVLLLWRLLKSKTWKSFMLTAEIKSKANDINKEIKKLKVGEMGIAISRLAPTGKAEFKGEYYEVQSETSFVDQKSAIEITRIEDTKIIIKPL